MEILEAEQMVRQIQEEPLLSGQVLITIEILAQSIVVALDPVQLEEQLEQEVVHQQIQDVDHNT